jgi:hypothetical protein
MFLKRLIGRLSQLVSEVIEASRNFGLYVFFTKRQPKVVKTSSAHSKKLF